MRAQSTSHADRGGRELARETGVHVARIRHRSPWNKFAGTHTPTHTQALGLSKNPHFTLHLRLSPLSLFVAVRPASIIPRRRAANIRHERPVIVIYTGPSCVNYAPKAIHLFSPLRSARARARDSSSSSGAGLLESSESAYLNASHPGFTRFIGIAAAGHPRHFHARGARKASRTVNFSRAPLVLFYRPTRARARARIFIPRPRAFFPFLILPFLSGRARRC